MAVINITETFRVKLSSYPRGTMWPLHCKHSFVRKEDLGIKSNQTNKQMHVGKNVGLLTFSHPHLCHTVKPDLSGVHLCLCMCILVKRTASLEAQHCDLFMLKEIWNPTNNPFSCGCCWDLNHSFLYCWASWAFGLVACYPVVCLYKAFCLFFWGLAHLETFWVRIWVWIMIRFLLIYISWGEGQEKQLENPELLDLAKAFHYCHEVCSTF